MYIVHGKRSDRTGLAVRASEVEEKIDELSKRMNDYHRQFADYGDRIDRLLDNILDLAKNLFEAVEGIQSGVAQRDMRLEVIEGEIEAMRMSSNDQQKKI